MAGNGMLEGLNEPQRQAVQTLRGPLLVLAGAGTGKTRVVTFRIANLIRHGIQPSRILAVTFTKKAAAEMQERVAERLGKRAADRPLVATFHAYCVQVLRRQIRHLGYPDQFAIYDRGDQEGLARAVLREIRVPATALSPGDLLYHVSRWKNSSVRPDQAASAASNDQEHFAAMGYRRYQRAIKAKGAVDFDDLLLCTEELFRDHPAVLAEETARFDHVLIDEYQDTNGTQYQIVRALAGQHRNLCVVGDDDQSIYGWRGAEVAHILRFTRDWPDAVVVRLEDNYRSSGEILELANRLIAHNKLRHPKTLRAFRGSGARPRVEQFADELQEAQAIAAEVARRIAQAECEPRDVAILFRTNEQPRAFEMELRRLKVPYVLIGGMSFFDRREVRDVLAYLKLLAWPEDEVALLRILNTPPRGLGPATAEKLLAEAVQRGQPVWRVLQDPQFVARLTAAGQQGVRNLQELVAEFAGLAKRPRMADALRELLARVQYQDEIRRLYPEDDDREARWAAVGELVNALAEYEAECRQPDLADFLANVALGGDQFDDEKAKQLQRNAVVLMTLHSAKGLEFPRVYMVGLEEGILPHHRSIDPDGVQETVDEERRLCYVGVTRAREHLTLSLALTRRKWGKPRDTHPSRFLFEMTGAAAEPAVPSQPAAKPTAPAPHRPRGKQRSSRRK